MKSGMIALIVSVTLIFVVSFSFMNYNYDTLSRYPYQDEESRKLIKKYLNSDEIEYIIEYSIAPSLFVNYIKEDRFNIYHAQEYYKLGVLRWQEDSQTIVNMVEDTRDYMDVNSLNTYLDNYSYSEIYFWIKNGDKYNSNSNLVINAGDMSAYVDDNYTLSIRSPFNLEVLNSFIPAANDGQILVDVAIQEPLKNMCVAIKDELLQSSSCGGLEIETGYVSYQQQEALYDVAKSLYGDEASLYEFYPGHSENQLGLAIEFIVDGVEKKDFLRTIQSTWLENNAHKFGFIQSYGVNSSITYNKKPRYNHYRFVGVELATYIYENNLTLKQALNR